MSGFLVGLLKPILAVLEQLPLVRPHAAAAAALAAAAAAADVALEVHDGGAFDAELALLVSLALLICNLLSQSGESAIPSLSLFQRFDA